MTRTLLSLAIAAPLAGVVVWQRGGVDDAEGLGVLVGFVVGALVSLWGIYFQRHTLRHRPAKAQNAIVIDFAVKLVVVLAGAMLLNSLPDVGARCDWRAFLLSFASVSLIVLTFGTHDVIRVLKNPPPASESVQ